MIQSLLDLDLYKLTVQQIVFHNFTRVNVKYKFYCRNNHAVNLLGVLKVDDIKNAIEALKNVKLTNREYTYLLSLGYFDKDYLDFLKYFTFDPSLVEIEEDLNTGLLDIVVSGNWLHVILYETMILSIINELYMERVTAKEPDVSRLLTNTLNRKLEVAVNFNLDSFKKLKLIEFGTRRRFSSEYQMTVIKALKECNCLAGTSNVYAAMLLDIPPVGTFGHEFPMGLQGVYPIQFSQKEAFKLWLHEYKGKWGSVLTDTLGHTKFLRDFTFDLAKAYDGVRHDSGDPFKFGESIIRMYKAYGIDPISKRIMFSDGLNIHKCIDLLRYFGGLINVGFGVGTHLTNDIKGFTSPSIVVKMVESNGQPVVKLSDEPQKVTCENTLYLEWAKFAANNL